MNKVMEWLAVAWLWAVAVFAALACIAWVVIIGFGIGSLIWSFIR